MLTQLSIKGEIFQRLSAFLVKEAEMKNERVWKKKQVDMEHEEEEESVKWVTHYSSDHQILLVGDGDFSFSLCLANSFGSATNIVATSLDSYDDVTRKYKQAKSNLDQLQKLGACVLHGVDATKMKLHSDLKMRRFDRVIFNFPHTGFHMKEDNLLMIKMHKDLVFGFFKNACCMLRANGEIHVNHKTTAPFSNWNIESLAIKSSLTLIECSDFKKEDYPGYNNKRGASKKNERGDSRSCDEPFYLGKCSTFKFIIFNPKARRNRKKRRHTLFARQQARLPSQEIQDVVEQLPTPLDLHYYPQGSHIPRMNEAVTSTFDLANGHTPKSRDYLNKGFKLRSEVHRISSPSAGYDAHGINLGSQRSLWPMDSLQSMQPWDRSWDRSTNARYSLTDHVGTIDAGPFSHGAINLGSQRSLRPMDSLQSMQLRDRSWDRSTNARYSLTDHVGTIDADPFSHGARNAEYQVFGGSSNYMQEAPCRRAQRSSYSDVGTRYTVHLSYGARNEDYQVFGDNSNYLQEAPYRTVKSSHFDFGRMSTVALSHGARNEDYRVFCRCSNCLQEAPCRRAQMSSYFDSARTDFDRYIAEETGRSRFVRS